MIVGIDKDIATVDDVVSAMNKLSSFSHCNSCSASFIRKDDVRREDKTLTLALLSFSIRLL